MTRAEAAAQAARAIGELVMLAHVAHAPDFSACRTLAERDLAAALLVLTDPADAIRGFLDAPLIPQSGRTIAAAWCCGTMFETYTAWEQHMHSTEHKP